MNNKLVKNFIHDNWKLLINEKNMNYVGQKKEEKNLYMKLECHKFTFFIFILWKSVFIQAKERTLKTSCAR